ncbi:MAG: M67 family metallopeptidase [Longimicrobiales bacterium]
MPKLLESAPRTQCLEDAGAAARSGPDAALQLHWGSPAALALAAATVRRLQRCARLVAPDECCGALLGERDRHGVARVHAALPLPNVAATPRTHYTVAPRALQRVHAAARGRALDILGFYHSHPAGGWTPSDLDQSLAWPWYIYLIVGHRLAAWCTAARDAPLRELPIRDADFA